jgi:hypothetical protein
MIYRIKLGEGFTFDYLSSFESFVYGMGDIPFRGERDKHRRA